MNKVLLVLISLVMIIGIISQPQASITLRGSYFLATAESDDPSTAEEDAANSGNSNVANNSDNQDDIDNNNQNMDNTDSNSSSPSDDQDDNTDDNVDVN